jgi:3-dehydroquinate synthase
MQTIPVKSMRGDYSIFVGVHLLEKSGTLLQSLGFTGKVCLVSQKKIARLHASKVLRSLRSKKFEVHQYFLPDRERAKSEKELFRLIQFLVKAGFERRDTVFALGGGVVGDLAGFAASSYFRGVPFVNAGTTLLAQVDSSIGGKTGINLKEGKNLVGAFYPAKIVISDSQTLRTLPDRELRASLAEVVKYGVIRDAKLFHLLETSSEAILGKDPKLLERIVAASSRIKAGVVSRDEQELKGERMILNFGHTFGHGFEQALQYKKLLHGEAVSIGMICAANAAEELGIFSRQDNLKLQRLLEAFELPVSIAPFKLSWKIIYAAMTRDKKKKGGRLRFILPTRIGKVIVRDDFSQDLIQKILKKAGALS